MDPQVAERDQAMARYHVPDLPIDRCLGVPYEFIDRRMADFSGSEVLILLYILRRTVGFQKGSDSISIKQFCQGIRKQNGTALDRGTGLSAATVKRTLADLETRGILSRQRQVKTNTGGQAPSRITLHWSRLMGV